MRVQIIPAQVTTVEDTIAGNLNLTQVILLVSSLFVNTAIYALVPKQMALNPLKVILIIAIFILFIGLSLRIKGRIVINWLVILLNYFLRPHLYLFNKNDVIFRDQTSYAPLNKKATKPLSPVLNKPKSGESQVDFQSILRNTDLNIRFTKKGLSFVKN